MVGNLIFVLGCAAFSTGTTALFALLGSNVSLSLLTIAFVSGVVAGAVAIRRYGSGAALWRLLRSRPPISGYPRTRARL